jgi:rubrerythrin
MMRRTKRLRDYPQVPWVDQKICPHPLPTLLMKFNDSDETVYRCDVCGKVMTRIELPLEAVR